MLTCLLTLIITHFYFTWVDVHMFWWLYAFRSYAYLPVCLHAHMLRRFDDKLTCIDIYMFDIHTCGSLNVYKLGGISDCVMGCTCAQMLWQLFLNAEEIGRLEVCLLGCINGHMLLCYHDHNIVYSHDQMLVFSHSLKITCSHVYLLWWSHAHMSTCFGDHIPQWML